MEPPKDIMNIQTIGSPRSKLSLAFAGASAPIGTGTTMSRPAFERRSPALSGTLSRRELRRIVTELLG